MSDTLVFATRAFTPWRPLETDEPDLNAPGRDFGFVGGDREAAQAASAAWMAELYEASGRGDIDSAVDVLYLNVDRYMRRGWWAGVDQVLADLRVTLLRPEVAIAALSITVGARTRLPSRSTLVEEVCAILRALGQEPARVLAGLL